MPKLIEAVLEQRIPARSGDTSSAVRARGSSHADPVWHYVTKALLRHESSRTLDNSVRHPVERVKTYDGCRR
jgi:hypothetical protein